VTGVSPNQPKNAARPVRIDDATWDAVKAEALERGITASDVVREAIREHLDRQR
jgi:hypothetical protein